MLNINSIRTTNIILLTIVAVIVVSAVYAKIKQSQEEKEQNPDSCLGLA